MRSYSLLFAENCLHMPVKADDFGLNSNLFDELAGERHSKRLADLYPAAGK